jgi:hypothetical protein
MDSSLVVGLSQQQTAAGGFGSTIDFLDRREEDCNGFATALVLRALRRVPGSDQLDGMKQRALDFLESCASPSIPGAFGFWPPDKRPAWGQRLSEDLDDTAIIALELALHGRKSRTEVQELVYQLLVPTLLIDIDSRLPTWIQSLVFPTWLTAGPKSGNPVDCCVNTNILALMSWCGLAHLPGYAEACTMVCSGLAWANHDLHRLRSLTPYYPNPIEFYEAVRHAITCGVVELEPAAKCLQGLLSTHVFSPTLRNVLCSNAYAAPFWRCPALELVRNAAS